jgi:hypothetical protein
MGRCEDYIEGRENVSVDFNDQDIVPVLRLLSDISGCNIVIHPEVRGKISIKLNNVPWNQLIDITLKMFGLGKSIEGNIIRIAPLSVFAHETLQEIKEQEALILTQPLVTKVIELRNAEVGDLELFINRLNILSSRGSVVLDKRTNTIVIKDITSVFPEIEKIIDLIDKPFKVTSAKTIVDDSNTYKYDLFICHASEDKESVVRDMANKLKGKNIRVWYDEFSIRLGDSLRRSIDKGLTQARYGVVVLSPNFFQKEWPQKELDGLTAREVNGERVILPVWHNVNRDDVTKYSIILADRVAASTKKGVDFVVDELLKVISPKSDIMAGQQKSSVRISSDSLRLMKAVRILLSDEMKEYRRIIEHLFEALEEAVPYLIESKSFKEFTRSATGKEMILMDIRNYKQAKEYVKSNTGFKFTSYGGVEGSDEPSAKLICIMYDSRQIKINETALSTYEEFHNLFKQRLKDI